MIKSYRSKKTIEACQWTGENRLELEDFIGKENIDFIIYSNKEPVPTVKTTKNGEVKLNLRHYVVKCDDEIEAYSENEFQELYSDI